ncbi:MAG TPA: biotin--[acetyl-CoA-carboxylase] ligase [Clostridiales bacterium]|nr:biotin--[acetyl-CoA-carboxylase] ligase [Clostridiales bacterium]
MKYKILEILKNNKGNFISGELLSSELGVTRTTIWKHIKDLKVEGYNIESSSKKGYVLVDIPDILNAYEIGYNLHTECLGKEIYCLQSVDSTNIYSRKIAHEGCKDGTVVVADLQTAGKGRLGRAWDSKDRKGIWMSVVLKPAILPSKVQVITLAASIAVVSGIMQAAGISTGIKWPNDIILDGKKVCGILTEMSSELDRVNHIILGIGLNVNHDEEDFPPELRGKATSLKIHKLSEGISGKWFRRSDIIKGILENLEESYNYIKDGRTDVLLEKWREFSITLGKEIRVVSENGEYRGIALGITEDGKLVVKGEDGATHQFISGEVSVRGMDCYVE